MPGQFSVEETLNTLKAIFEKHKNERICALGTICVGKSTLLNQLARYNCVDMDAELWPNLPPEEMSLLNQLRACLISPFRRISGEFSAMLRQRPLA